MSELNLPVLWNWEVANNVEFDLDEKEVYFELKKGSLCVVCTMSANINKGDFEVNVDSDPQNNIDRTFAWLGVDDSFRVKVDQTDIELEPNQDLMLTEQQIKRMNELLKDDMRMI